MIKINKNITQGVRKLRPKEAKAQAKKLTKSTAPKETKKEKKKNFWANYAARQLERTPKKDEVEISKKIQTKAGKKSSSSRNSKTVIGDFLIRKNRVLAEKFKDDLEIIAQNIPEVTFIREFNDTSAKELKSILDKLQKRSAQFIERGFKGVIRDSVRSRIFMPNADKNYMKIVESMEKRGYKVAKNFAEDAQGNAIKNPNGTFKMIDDIDIRFGKNACKSGYEDVQIRFQKGDVLYELIILPGPNYMNAANKEHDVFENIKKYSIFNLDKDVGAKQIISAIGDIFSEFSKRLYADALLRDNGGVRKITEPITFTEEEVKNINALFKSLKTLFLGKFNSLPPSKKYCPEFKDTKTFANLNFIETNLKKFMDFYKPIEKIDQV